MNQIRIGVSGWTYPLWRKTFYPAGLPVKKEFDFVGQHFSTVEINGTFYRTQNPATFREWYERAPKNMVFSVKGNKFITHSKRLKDVRKPLANFFASGVLELQEKLGPILWQFPPQMKFSAERFREFFELLPRTSKQALTLAKEHDLKIEGADSLKNRPKARLRYAVEIRNDSFRTTEFFELLREFNIAYCIADTADRWIYAEDLTADFVYIRLHGFKELYSGGYTPEAISSWSKKILAWQNGGPAPGAQTVTAAKLSKGAKKKDVFVYFDNDAKVNAPFDAAALMSSLSKRPELIHPELNPKILLGRRHEVSQKMLLKLQTRALNR